MAEVPADLISLELLQKSKNLGGARGSSFMLDMAQRHKIRLPLMTRFWLHVDVLIGRWL